MNAKTLYPGLAVCRPSPACRRLGSDLAHAATPTGPLALNLGSALRSIAFLVLVLGLVSAMGSLGHAQVDLVIYSDALAADWFNYPWAKADYANSSPVHSGGKSVRVSAKAGEGLLLAHAELDLSFYSDLSFWIHGGAGGGQLLQVLAVVKSQPKPPAQIDPLVADQWQHVTIPLAALGVAGETGMNGLAIIDRSETDQPAFYVDDLRLVAAPLPVLPETVHIRVDATQRIRTVDARLFGVNAAIWDAEFDTPSTVSLLQAMYNQALRFPGGSLSDEYHWASNTTGSNTRKWATSFDRFARVALQTGAQVFITANYGTGTAQEAAEWVRYSNVTQK